MILIYIPIHLCELYHQQGWSVMAMKGSHGLYSMLAWREA